MRQPFLLSLILLWGLSYPLSSQTIDQEHSSYPYALTSLDWFKELLAIPNDANYPEDILKNVAWCETQLEAYQFSTQRLATPTVPLLLAERSSPLAQQATLLFYFHIDGQPVDPSFWFQDDPYQAVLKEEKEGEGWIDIDWSKLKSPELNPEWRIFARSASDDKSPFVMLLAVLEQLKKSEEELPYNLKIILDFEEEKGSPRLADAVVQYKNLLQADQLLIFDGPKHISNQPTLTFGARGITTITLQVFGPTFPLHSGHYGNYAPNPALRLSQLLAGMKDEEGRVLIKGFYDGIQINESTKAILANVPDDEREFKVKLGIGETDKVGANYQEALQYPSLNIRGLSAGWVGKEARTIVPASATAEIDIRLVVESEPKRLVALVRQYIEDQGYYLIDRKPTSRERFQHPKICRFTNNRAYQAFRTELDAPLGLWAYESLTKTFGQAPIRVRTFGGSLPISPFINTLDIPALIVPLVNSDNNQHSPNENLRLGNYFDGVKTMYGLLTNPYPNQ
ncbi:MAG: M20/M25/M40 family metallo-hydrolase [Bacteroidota bacterium]